MTEAQSKGVATLLAWLNGSVERSRARALVDGLTDSELADVLDVVAAAHTAEGNRGAVLLESAAARLRGVDVERDGSGPGGGGEPKLCREDERCVLREGHRGAHQTTVTATTPDTDVLEFEPVSMTKFCGATVGEVGRCLKRLGHTGDHSALITAQVRELHVPPELELVQCGERAGDDITKRCTLQRGHRGLCAHVTLPEVA